MLVSRVLRTQTGILGTPCSVPGPLVARMHCEAESGSSGHRTGLQHCRQQRGGLEPRADALRLHRAVLARGLADAGVRTQRIVQHRANLAPVEVRLLTRRAPQRDSHVLHARVLDGELCEVTFEGVAGLRLDLVVLAVRGDERAHGVDTSSR